MCLALILLHQPISSFCAEKLKKNRNITCLLPPCHFLNTVMSAKKEKKERIFSCRARMHQTLTADGLLATDETTTRASLLVSSNPVL